MSSERRYMHPRADKAFHDAQVAANLRLVVVQTLGNAPDSKGVHEQDGTYTEPDGDKVPYTAALDISVNQGATIISTGKHIAMDDAHIKWALHNLAEHGFVAWYRRKSQGFDAVHIHAVYAGVKMKPALQSQVRDFLNDRTGLKGHATETYWTADASTDAEIRKLFEQYN